MNPFTVQALLCAFALFSLAIADTLSELNNLIRSSKPPSPSSAYFVPQYITFSKGRHAACASGKVQVPVTSQNTRFTTQPPPNQFTVNEIVQEILQYDASLIQASTAGTITVEGTYSISANLCYPAKFASSAQVKSIQILTHGSGFEKSYWDIASPNNSYVDAAADAGYATLAYDRLGAGQSDRPEPINIIQSAIHIEVLEGLIQGVRKGTLGMQKFNNVICAGHSYGQIIQTGHDRKYPSSCSAVLATGISDTTQYLVQETFALNPTIASEADPVRFGVLNNAFWVDPTAVSVQLPFFRYPSFDPVVFRKLFETRSTYTIGEIFTATVIFTPAPAFTGPVGVVDGQFDIPFCGGDCGQRPSTYRATFYSAAVRSMAQTIPNTGHAINGHITAPQAFNHLLEFLKQNNL